MSKSDDIDELVSSVRNFVAHKETHRMTRSTPADKLMLTPENRLTDEQVKAIDAEWAAELKALEVHGIVAPGKALELSMDELEAAVAKLPDDWETAPTPKPMLLQDQTTPAPEAPWEDEAPATPEIEMGAIEEMITARMGELIDHEALRALVVKTVHEELGGELGERITRNVRKLVRREINRVLTSRDLTGD